MHAIARRLAPFAVLLDVRYLPLVFVVAPQAYAVYLWLWLGSDGSTEAWIFSVLGAVGYEMVYVAAIAWAEQQHKTRWTDITAWVALIFSVSVAVYVYRDQGAAAILHAGFPLVGFAYTLAMHPVVTADTVVAEPEDVPVTDRERNLTHVALLTAQGLNVSEIAGTLGWSSQKASYWHRQVQRYTPAESADEKIVHIG